MKIAIAACVLLFAACQSEVGTESTEQELKACIPVGSYGNAWVPPAKPWTTLPATPAGAVVIVDSLGGGKGTAYGVDWHNSQILWTRSLLSGDLGEVTEQVDLAGLGFLLRPPPRPNPPGSENLLQHAEVVGALAADY